MIASARTARLYWSTLSTAAWHGRGLRVDLTTARSSDEPLDPRSPATTSAGAAWAPTCSSRGGCTTSSRSARPTRSSSRTGPAHRHRRAGRRALQRERPLAAHRHGLRRQLRRRLRRRLQAPRLRLPRGSTGASSARLPADRRATALERARGRRPLGPRRARRRCARLRERHPGGEAAVIGPAGENQVLFASIVNNRGRSVGRGGLGAVMGAKRLKAIVVSADGDLQPRPGRRGALRLRRLRGRARCSSRTRSPRRRCPSSAPPCWSTC